MIMDRTLLFSDRQAITASAASTNVVELGETGTVYGATSPVVRDIGNGTAIPLTVAITEGFNNLTSLTIAIQVDDNAAFTSAKTVYTTPAIVLADLGAGDERPLPDFIPRGTNERFLRLYYTVTGTAPSLGRITAGVSMGNQTN